MWECAKCGHRSGTRRTSSHGCDHEWCDEFEIEKAKEQYRQKQEQQERELERKLEQEQRKLEQELLQTQQMLQAEITKKIIAFNDELLNTEKGQRNLKGENDWYFIINAYALYDIYRNNNILKTENYPTADYPGSDFKLFERYCLNVDLSDLYYDISMRITSDADLFKEYQCYNDAKNYGKEIGLHFSNYGRILTQRYIDTGFRVVYLMHEFRIIWENKSRKEEAVKVLWLDSSFGKAWLDSEDGKRFLNYLSEEDNKLWRKEIIEVLIGLEIIGVIVIGILAWIFSWEIMKSIAIGAVAIALLAWFISPPKGS
jgi:hypothetical protein